MFSNTSLFYHYRSTSAVMLSKISGRVKTLIFFKTVGCPPIWNMACWRLFSTSYNILKSMYICSCCRLRFKSF